MPITRNNGVELYWECRGSGPPLILGAGLGGVGGWWDPNRNVLAEQFSGTPRACRAPSPPQNGLRQRNMGVTIDQAGKDAATWHIDNIVRALLEFLWEADPFADPNNTFSFDDNGSLGNRLIQRAINDLLKQNRADSFGGRAGLKSSEAIGALRPQSRARE